MASHVTCHSCGTQWPVLGHVGRRDECSKCRADLHACKSCVHYDATAYNECREPQAEVVREKDRANFCDYYQPRQGAGQSAADRQKDLRAAAEALFKKKS